MFNSLAGDLANEVTPTSKSLNDLLENDDHATTAGAQFKKHRKNCWFG
jgi:hypothetical protein